MYGNFLVTVIEYNILAVEIETYNIWISTFLMSGKGPRCSYENIINDADPLIFVNDPGYQQIFGRPGVRWPYEHPAISFELVNLSDPDSEGGEIYQREGIEGLNIEPSKELVDI